MTAIYLYEWELLHCPINLGLPWPWRDDGGREPRCYDDLLDHASAIDSPNSRELRQGES